MVGVQVTDEQLESITDRTVQEADEDGDGAVSFMEFTKVSSGDQEALGQKEMGVKFTGGWERPGAYREMLGFQGRRRDA